MINMELERAEFELSGFYRVMELVVSSLEDDVGEENDTMASVFLARKVSRFYIPVLNYLLGILHDLCEKMKADIVEEVKAS